MRVLVVDDSVVVRDRLVLMLSELQDVEVVGIADDAPGAIASVARLRPDLVVLDIRIPGGSGFEVLEQVRRGGPSTVVIMLTNYAYPEYRQRCLAAGADFFFDKSTEFDRIPELVEGLVRDNGNTVDHERDC